MCLNNYKILAFSDSHGPLPKIEEEFDLLLIPGDIVELRVQDDPNRSKDWFLNNFVSWINTLPFKDNESKVLWIAGNHEVAFYNDPNRLGIARDVNVLTNGRAIYLEDRLIETHGLKIYGTPWCRIFGYWAFMRSNDILNQYYDKIPFGLDILLTHDAPYGTSDMCYGWYALGRTPEHIGNKPLRDAILKKAPKYNIHGHLHSANHECEILGDTKVYCVSLVDENYIANYPLLKL